MSKHVSGNWSIRMAILMADFFILNILLLIFVLLGDDKVPDMFHEYTKVMVLLANISLGIAEYFYGTIVHHRIVSMIKVTQNTLKLTMVQVAVMFITLKLIDSRGESFFLTMVAFFCCEYIALLISRFLENVILKEIRRHGRNTRSVLFVGTDPAQLELYRTLISDMSLGYHVMGYFADAEDPELQPKLPYRGTLADLERMMHAVIDMENNPSERPSAEVLEYEKLLHVDEIFCCLSHDLSNIIIDIMRYCDRNLIHFFYIPRQFGIYKLNLRSMKFNDINVMTNLVEPLENPVNRFLKRIFDIVFSSVVCLCLLPFIPIIGLIIKIQSPGPIFFRQDRTGYNGKTFKCIKFRSMHVNKDSDKKQATEHDPRKFPFGNFMRKANIDELPQFFNVLMGDMSVVGPRPHMLYHTEVYSKLINKYMVRHFCKPGITGLAQVRGFRGETKELWQMESRVRLDIYYIENWTFMQDLVIIFKTFFNVFEHDANAY